MSNKNEVSRKRNNNITPLEKQAIKRLVELNAEKKRREKSAVALKSYNTGDKVHLKQLAFHKCQKRNRWVFGGNRSGKTECGAVECIYTALGIHPYRQNRKNVFGWVVSLSREVQRDVAQKKILKYLPKDKIIGITMSEGSKGSPEYGVIDQIRVKNALGGESVIGFKSCEEGREKFQGSSLDFVWFDEEPPEDIYKECKMRLIDKKGDMFGTMTPLKGLTFVYDEIFLNVNNDDNVWYEFIEWADNPYLDKAEIEELTKNMSNDELESRRYGKFRSGTGLVYPEFDENLHVIEPFDVPADWQDNISIDPGLNNPLSCHWYAVDYDGNVYVVAEHFEAGKGIEYHADKIKEISERLGWKKGNGGRYDALIDSASEQKTLASPRSVAELFYDYGINVNTRVNKDLFTGIQRVKSYLSGCGGKPKLYVFKTCPVMISEFKSYWWGTGDRPKKVDDHAMDELRYYIMTKPENNPIIKKSFIEADKERRYRKLRRNRKNEFL